MSWLSDFAGILSPGAGFGGQQYNYQAPPPPDNRSYYTGTFGADQFNQTGNVNQTGDPANGPKEMQDHPYRGSSQLASVQNGAHYGYQAPQLPGPYFDPYAGDINGLPLSGYYQGVAAPHAREPGQANAGLPKPHELPQNAQPMMGQWGGGGWNVGGGAPASMQPMWLGSMNGGQSWAQAPGYNNTAPKAGQTNSTWSQAPNQDPDSPTWIARG